MITKHAIALILLGLSYGWLLGSSGYDWKIELIFVIIYITAISII